MTHEHDFELIASIAEGEMSPADQAAAEALLASCEKCRVDLHLQREALAALRAAPAVAMTDFERATLHRNVAGSLAPSTPQATAQRSIPWFQRLVPAMAAAAALLVVVGVGSVLIGGDAGDFDAAAETTTVAGEAQRTGADEEMAQIGGALESDDLTDPTTTTMAALAPAVSAVEDLGEISISDLQDIAAELTLEPSDGAATDADGNLEFMTLSAELRCLETAAEAGDITAIRRAAVEGVDVEIYRIGDRVDVYARSDCSLYDSFE